MKDGQERTTANFLRGLTIGAIIGAVIAGSRLWRALRTGGDRADRIDRT